MNVCRDYQHKCTLVTLPYYLVICFYYIYGIVDDTALRLIVGVVEYSVSIYIYIEIIKSLSVYI